MLLNLYMVQVPVSDEACELELTYKDIQIHVGDFVFIEPRYLNFFCTFHQASMLVPSEEKTSLLEVSDMYMYGYYCFSCWKGYSIYNNASLFS